MPRKRIKLAHPRVRLGWNLRCSLLCIKSQQALRKRCKQINRFIFEESGVLIGNALKSARNKEALFGGVLGIRHFCKDDAQYYYSGYLGKSINRSFPHACRIRKVCSTGQTLQFQRYLPLLEVDFIRANGWTVIPFPFKYLREWRLQQG